MITDQQVLNGSVGIGSGLNGTTWLSTSQGTFEGQFFDNTPTSIDVNGTPGSAAAAVGTNLGIGMWNQIADFGNSFMTNLTVGQYSLNLPNVPGGLGNAAFSGQALAMLLPLAAGGEEETAEEIIAGSNEGKDFEGVSEKSVPRQDLKRKSSWQNKKASPSPRRLGSYSLIVGLINRELRVKDSHHVDREKSGLVCGHGALLNLIEKAMQTTNAASVRKLSSSSALRISQPQIES